MHEELNLVADLALIFISAGVITLVFKWLKQPVILGYIIVGFLVGPHFGLFPEVTSVSDVKQWSEIGIIFLLFALGLEFSFKKLMKVGSTALITASTIFIGMFLSGLGIGKALSWTTTEAVFLGGMLSMSSTTIIIKAFDDLGFKKKPFTNIVFGTLIVEDLLAILLMVLLSTFAVTKQFAGMDMLSSFFKLGFFIILWFTIGIFIIPTFLKKVRKILNEETLLLLSVGLCFGMVVFASYVGFSSALGAFVMGTILAETIEGERTEKVIKGVKNLFGAVFFVSVGMMVDPGIIVEYWKPVLILTMVVLVGISFFATTGVLLSGKPLKMAIRSGLSMAQIGEFAFIIAGLGYTLGVMSDFIYPVVVTVSVITTFTTPYFMRNSDAFSDWLYRKLPNSLIDRMENYSSGSGAVTKKSDWGKLLKAYFMRIILYVVLLIAISLAASLYLAPFVMDKLPNVNDLILKWGCILITIVAMSPFLYGLAVNKASFSSNFEKLWYDNRSNRAIIISLIFFRVLLATLFFTSVFFHYFDFSYWVLVVVFVGIIIFLIISRNDIHRLEFMEKRFYNNLNHKEQEERRNSPIKASVKTLLSKHDIHVEKAVVSPNSPYIGKQLSEVPFRQSHGVNIIKIIRGNTTISLPSGQEYIYPFDVVYALGTEMQIADFIEDMEKEDAEFISGDAQVPVIVTSFIIEKTSPIYGVTLADSIIRDKGCMVIGVVRADESIMNPSPDFMFEEGDVVWMAGEEDAIKRLI